MQVNDQSFNATSHSFVCHEKPLETHGRKIHLDLPDSSPQVCFKCFLFVPPHNVAPNEHAAASPQVSCDASELKADTSTCMGLCGSNGTNRRPFLPFSLQSGNQRGKNGGNSAHVVFYHDSRSRGIQRAALFLFLMFFTL